MQALINYNKSGLLGIVLLCMVGLLIANISNAIISEMMHSHNPNSRVKGSGDLSIGSLTSPKDFYHDNCDLRITAINETVVTNIVKKCSHNEVLKAHSNLLCENIEPTKNYAQPRCYEVRPCQTDMCKYNCNFTQHHTIHMNISVRPWGSLLYRSNNVVERTDTKFQGVGMWFDYGVEWDNAPFHSRIDDNGQIPAYAPNVVICDYSLDSYGNMTSLYINRRGSFIGIIVEFSLGAMVLCTFITLLFGVGYAFCTAPW